MRAERGYTLVEVLVAIFIFAIIAAVTASALFNIFKLREVHRRHSQGLMALQRGVVILERDLEQMIGRQILDAASRVQRPLVFDKNAKDFQLKFTRTGYSNPLAVEKRSRMQRVGYRYADKKLIRATWPHLDRVSDEPNTELPILKNVSALTWRFMGEDKQFYTLWPPTAQWADRLPRAIEVTITFKDFGQLRRIMLIPPHTLIKTLEQPDAP